MALAPVPLDLPAPPEPGDTRRHDPTFESWDATVCGLRDTVNRVVGVLNDLGAGIPALPEGSLRSYLVEPLTGDHVAIRRNAEACAVLDDALATLAGNLARTTAWTDLRWGGEAAVGFAAGLGARAVGMRAVGELVGAGRVVFDEVADFCEWLTVEVEGLVVELGELLQRLARRVLTRVSGPWGWGVFALECATQGLGAFTDIIDDVVRAFELVETLLGLQDTVAGWAEEQRARLRRLLDAVALLEAWAA